MSWKLRLWPLSPLTTLLEAMNALGDKSITIPPTAVILDQFIPEPSAPRQIMEFLQDPVKCIDTRDASLTQVRAAVPDFVERFVQRRLRLEEPRGAGQTT